jgi:hypothetical protein
MRQKSLLRSLIWETELGTGIYMQYKCNVFAMYTLDGNLPGALRL